MDEIKIKICGLSRLRDIEYINEVLPNFAGFVFADSKRKVNMWQVKEMCQVLSPKVKRVGVFVNEDVQNILRIAEYCSLDIVQLHGNETEQQINELKSHSIEVWKAVRIGSQEEVEKIRNVLTDHVLVDAYVKNTYGGSGKLLNSNWFSACSKEWVHKKLIFAGGLNINNVSEIIQKVSPYAVDVSSGVEENGYKDQKKIQKFCQVIRNG